MADFDELKLDKSAAPPPPPQPRWVLIVAVVALLVAAVAIWFYFRGSSDTAEPSTSATVAPPRGLDAGGSSPEAELPPLDESDAAVRDLVRTLSQHPIVASLLTTDQLIRTFAVSIHNLADGDTPASHLHKIPPGSPFVVQRQGGRIYIDPRSYARFDGHAAAVDGIDPAGAARLYMRVKPRLAEAYRELAGADADVDRAFARAVEQVLKTPIVEGPIAVQPATVGYAYADPALASLPRAQQQVLRLGPANIRIVQEKVRAIARELRIDIQ